MTAVVLVGMEGRRRLRTLCLVMKAAKFTGQLLLCLAVLYGGANLLLVAAAMWNGASQP